MRSQRIKLEKMKTVNRDTNIKDKISISNEDLNQ